MKTSQHGGLSRDVVLVLSYIVQESVRVDPRMWISGDGRSGVGGKCAEKPTLDNALDRESIPGRGTANGLRDRGGEDGGDGEKSGVATMPLRLSSNPPGWLEDGDAEDVDAGR